MTEPGAAANILTSNLIRQEKQEAAVSVTDQYLANNADYAKAFNGPLPLPPSKHVAVVACMDCLLYTSPSPRD